MKNQWQNRANCRIPLCKLHKQKSSPEKIALLTFQHSLPRPGLLSAPLRLSLRLRKILENHISIYMLKLVDR